MFFSYNRNVQLHGKVPKDDETQREGERQGERERGRERGRETESVGRGGGGMYIKPRSIPNASSMTSPLSPPE